MSRRAPRVGAFLTGVWSRFRRVPLDTMLKRIAYICSIPIAVIAIWTFFSTVIPTNRLARLDDQVAEQELELRLIKRELASAYAQMRSQLIHTALWVVGPKCTGLLEDPPSVDAFERLEDAFDGAFGSAYLATPTWERILSSDVRGCVLTEVDGYVSLNQLRVSDRVAFLTELSGALDRIALDQQQSLKNAKSLPLEARRDGTVLPRDDTHTRAILDLYQDRSEAEIAKLAFEARVERAQLMVAMKWGDRARTTLLQVARMRWPE